MRVILCRSNSSHAISDRVLASLGFAPFLGRGAGQVHGSCSSRSLVREYDARSLRRSELIVGRMQHGPP